MNKDSIEGTVRKTVGQVEEIAGRATKDKQMRGAGLYDQAAGSVQNAYGQAREAITRGASEVATAAKGALGNVANADFGALRDDVAKLTQAVSELVQNNISESASVAQDKLISVEADLEKRIKTNPWSAVMIALGVGILIGKMS